jgi:membrane associated rhomboid family serine protease
MWRQLGDLQKKMLLLSLGLSFLFIFAFSFGVGVDMSAHLGGFLAGLVRFA